MTTIWSGLTSGALYSLVAIGYNIVLLASGVFNFAYAQLIMLGTYAAYCGAVTFGLPLVGVVAVGGAVVGAVAVIEHWIAIRPLLVRGDFHGMLITTVGVATVIDGLVVLIWGPNALTVPPPLPGTVVHVLGGDVPPAALLLIGLVLALGIGCHIWTKRTLIGLAALACGEDRQAAMVRGINVRRLSTSAMLASGVIAGLVGVVVGSQTYADPNLGTNLAIFGFVAIAIGGEGNHLGGLFGGFLIGMIYALAERYTNTSWSDICVFVVFLLVLLTRPTGIFGAKVKRYV
jgi:branched-chain amino acid transport system permease protein